MSTNTQERIDEELLRRFSCLFPDERSRLLEILRRGSILDYSKATPASSYSLSHQNIRHLLLAAKHLLQAGRGPEPPASPDSWSTTRTLVVVEIDLMLSARCRNSGFSASDCPNPSENDLYLACKALPLDFEKMDHRDIILSIVEKCHQMMSATEMVRGNEPPPTNQTT